MILIMLGSSQDLNMRHKEEKTTIYLLLWTRSPRMNYSRITPEAGMVMKRPPVMISLSGRVLGTASKHSQTRVNDDGGCGTFHGWRLGYLGFSRGT